MNKTITSDDILEVIAIEYLLASSPKRIPNQGSNTLSRRSNEYDFRTGPRHNRTGGNVFSLELFPNGGRKDYLRSTANCLGSMELCIGRRQIGIVSYSFLRVERPQANGKTIIWDTGTNERYIVYTPCHSVEFATGHVAGRWYVKRSGDVLDLPRSMAFSSRGSAVSAVGSCTWKYGLWCRSSRSA
jgi:hypothetical protein